MKIQSSYIFLKHPYKREEKKTNEDPNVIVIDIGNNIFSFIEKQFSNVKSIKDETNLFVSKLRGTISECEVTFLIHDVAKIEYLDIIVEGCTKKKIVDCLESVQKNLLKSGVRDYYVEIISYDALSEYYCNKIVGKLNSFERNIRKLMYNIYTLKFGEKYYQATMTFELQNKIKGVININTTREEKNKIKMDYHVNNSDAEAISRIQNFFSSFEFTDMQSFLFETGWTSFDEKEKNIFLSKHKDLSELTDEELRNAFNQLTPKSDWERFFSSKIPIENINERIDCIRRYRNSVAHFKRFSKEDYNDCNRIINELNKAVIKAIRITEEEDFSEKNVDMISNLLSGFTERMEHFMEPLLKAVKNSFVQSLQSLIDSSLEPIRKSFEPISISKSNLELNNDNYEFDEEDNLETDGIN